MRQDRKERRKERKRERERGNKKNIRPITIVCFASQNFGHGNSQCRGHSTGLLIRGLLVQRPERHNKLESSLLFSDPSGPDHKA